MKIFSIFLPIALGFVQFLSQGFFQCHKSGNKAVANQQEHFIDFIFIINMHGRIALFQHKQLYGGIVYKSQAIAQLQDFSG